MKIKYTILFSGILLITQLAYSQGFKITKVSGNTPLTDQSIVYALPRTGISIQLTLKQTVVTPGIFAKYAQKYLGLEHVAISDSNYWTIDQIELKPFTEPDPEQYYLLTFKTYPQNLNSLLTFNNQGIILNPSENWNNSFIEDFTAENKSSTNDPYFIDETIKEDIDTLYKTVLNDTSFIRIPVFKKQIIAKSEEELAKETAHQLIKTRKIKTKFTRGEFEYHPDAQTLKFMIQEMEKLEKKYLSLFQGYTREYTKTVQYKIIPNIEQQQYPICNFSAKTGISEYSGNPKGAIMLQLKKENLPTSSPGKPINLAESNAIYLRIPYFANLTILLNDLILLSDRLPVYQLGNIQKMAVLTK